MQKQKALVTGAAGFIGSHLTSKLLQNGHSVVGLDNLSAGTRENLELALAPLTTDQKNCFKFIQGDIRDVETVKKACIGADVAFHLAAIVSVPLSFAEPVQTAHVNEYGFAVTSQTCARAGVKKFIYASSSAVYGNTQTVPTSESVPAQPLSPYGASKYANELLANVLAKPFAMSMVGFRYFNIFGPRQNPNGSYASVIPKWIHSTLKGQSCLTFGDGSQTRDFIHIDDVVQANLLAAEVSLADASQVFNVGTGVRVSLRELSAHFLDYFGSQFKHEMKLAREGDILHSTANIQKIQNSLGFKPEIGLADGLKNTIESYR